MIQFAVIGEHKWMDMSRATEGEQCEVCMLLICCLGCKVISFYSSRLFLHV